MVSIYNRALSEVGVDGKFQRNFSMIYNIMFPILWIMAYNNIILALAVTPYTCKPILENTSDNSWKSKYIPMVADSAGNEKFSNCLIYDTYEINRTITCDKYDFDTTWYNTTVPSEYNWVCDKELYVANIFAYSKIGDLVGSLFFGWFGDMYGRRLTYIISLVLLLVGRAISIFSGDSHLLFAIGCVIAAFPSTSAVQSTAIISLEITSSNRRPLIAKLSLISVSLGMFLMPLLYWWIKNWKPFMIITTVTQIPFLLFSWKQIESPQWLWLNNENEKCLKRLKQIAKVNDTEIKPETKEVLVSSSIEHTDKNKTFGLFALFSGWNLALNTILQLCLWISISLSYTVIVMSSGEKSDGNPFLEFALQSLAEVPGHFLAAWLADLLGRRRTGAISSGMTAVIWAFLSFRENFSTGWIKSGWLGTVLIILNRLVLTVTYYTINLFNMELYPICLRQTGMSLGNVISGGGSAIAPYILYLGRNYDTRLPGAILSVTTVLGGVLSSLCLPETLNARLPETIVDARKFGKSKLRWRQHRGINLKYSEQYQEHAENNELQD